MASNGMPWSECKLILEDKWKNYIFLNKKANILRQEKPYALCNVDRKLY